MIFRYTADTCNHVQYIELNVFLFSKDPKTIEHEQAEGGDLYAMPQKVNNKKGKEEEEEEEVAQMYILCGRQDVEAEECRGEVGGE